METNEIKIKSWVKRKTQNRIKIKSHKKASKPPNKMKMLQYSIGIIYLWFGALKFFNSISPAEVIAVDTIQYLTAGILPPEVCLFMLAVGETSIALMLLFNVKKRIVIALALLHLIGTFSPIFIMPDQIFTCTVFVLSLTGQYIVKNLIIFSSLVVLYPSKSVLR